MKALIFGATGMVGHETLLACLKQDAVTSVISVSRRPVGLAHTKLKEVLHSDFLDYSNLQAELADSNICFFCIGVYQNKVPKDKFWEITVDYLAVLIAELEKVNSSIVFCLFSAQGADPGERSPFLFAKAKGRAERLLFESNLKNAYAFRPGFINPIHKKALSGMSQTVFQWIYRLLPFLGINADDLGNVMLAVGIEGNKKRVLENREIRLLAEELSKNPYQ